MPTEAPFSPEQQQQIGVTLQQIRPRLLAHFRKFPLSHEDTEDILQESMLVVVRRWHEIDDPGSFILGTVRRQTLAFLRRRRNQREISVDEASLERFEDSRHPQAESDLRHDVHVLLAMLPGRGVRLVAMRYGEGLSSGEIAAELCYSATSVRKLAARHLSRLQRYAERLRFRR